MPHSEYRRIVPHGTSAVLFIHGIVGTPDHFAPFVELVPPELSVVNLLLDGHGKGVSDFSRTSMDTWEKQVTAAVDELAQSHEHIYIVAHSMGTLLAIEQALRCGKVRELFLLAVPLQIRLQWSMVTNALKVYTDRITPDDAAALAAKNCCGVTHSKNPFAYFGWIPRFLELFRKIARTRRLLPYLTVPCTVYQSCRDELVSPGSLSYMQDLPCVTAVKLPSSGHYYYPDSDFALLTRSFRRDAERWAQEA